MYSKVNKLLSREIQIPSNMLNSRVMLLLTYWVSRHRAGMNQREF